MHQQILQSISNFHIGLLQMMIGWSIGLNLPSFFIPITLSISFFTGVYFEKTYSIYENLMKQCQTYLLQIRTNKTYCEVFFIIYNFLTTLQHFICVYLQLNQDFFDKIPFMKSFIHFMSMVIDQIYPIQIKSSENLTEVQQQLETESELSVEKEEKLCDQSDEQSNSSEITNKASKKQD